MYQLDHIMWAGADLDSACAIFEERAGIKFDEGGTHPGLGTRNRMTGLGAPEFFEVIAPDPEQRIDGTFGEQFLQFKEPQIFAVIFSASDLERVQEVYRSVGIVVEIVSASRVTRGGEEIRWRMLSMEPGPLTPFAPRFLDWLDSPHPSTRVKHQCSLQSLKVSHPEREALAAIWSAHGLDTPIIKGPASFSAVLQTPNGAITL